MSSLRVLQLNVDHCREGQGLALQSAREHRADVLILSDMFTPPNNNGRWAYDASRKVAIVATGSYPIQRVWGCTVPGLVTAKVAGIIFISVYAPPSLSPQEYERLLEAVELEASSHSHVVIVGDFNAWHTE